MNTREPESYRLEQGMPDPRNPEQVGWRHWESFTDRDLALKEGKLLARSGFLSRVLEVRVLKTFGGRQ
jgi:hypothetical protein